MCSEYSKASNASEPSKYSMCSQAPARHTNARPGRRSTRSMARRPRLGMNDHQNVALDPPSPGKSRATRATTHPDHGGGWFAAGCPQRSDGRAVGCGQPGACLGGWWWLGRRTQCGRPDTFGGCPARPQWARRAIGRGRGPDHSIGAQSVAPRLWTAPLTTDGLGRHRPRAGAGRFAAVAKTVCAPPSRGRAHGWLS